MTLSGLRAYLRRCHYPAMLFLAALPPALALTARFAADYLPAAWALLAASAAFACLCIAMPGKRRRPASLLAAALLFALGTRLLPLGAQPPLLLMPLAAAALMLSSLPLAGRAITGVSPAFYIGGVISHLLVHAVIHFSRGAVRIRYDALTPALLAALLLYLLLLLLSLNSISLDNATMARCRLPASMRRINTLLTLGFLILSAGISALPAAARLIAAVVRSVREIVRLIGAFVTWMLGDAPVSMGGGAPQEPMDMLAVAGPAKEPSLFAVLFEKLVTFVALLILIAGIFIILRFLLKKLYAISLRALARLRAYAAAVSEDYEDEITDTRFDGSSASFSTRVRRRFAATPMPAEPTARIRWRYARLLRRNCGWADSSTARENLSAEAAALYERARYSDLPVMHEDAKRFEEYLTRK